MPKTISVPLRQALQSETMSTATCLMLELVRFTPKITAITKANPGVVTTDIEHGLTTGDTIIIRGGDMVEIDDTNIVVTVLSTTTFEVDQDTTAYTDYTGGARCNPLKGFTDHDQNITFDKVTFLGNTGYTPSATTNSGDLSVDNLDMYGLIDSETITDQDIIAGKYDYCRLWLFLLDYTNLAALEATIKYGRIGEVSMQRDLFSAEFRGLAQALDQDTITHYVPSCFATLGDSKCGVDLTLAAFNHTGSVTAVPSQRLIEDTTLSEADDYWQGGVLRWTGGNNAGREVEIKAYLLADPASGNNPTIQLIEPEFGQVQIGDTYTMTRGCDKSLATCRDVFANVINYRGYPHLPGLSEMLNYGNRQSEVT